MKIPRLLAGMIGIALTLAACGGTSSPQGSKVVYPSSVAAAQDTGSLKVLTFAGYDNPKFDTSFVNAFPNAGKVQYSFADSNEAFLAKLKSGGATPDIVFGVCVNQLPNWKQTGLIAPIDTTALTNWKDLDPNAEKLGVINGTQWEPVMYYGYDSLVAATNRSVPPPTSWKDLWSPTYKGQFSMINYAENGVQMAAVAYGLPYPNLSDAQLAVVKQHLLDLRKNNIKSFWTAVGDPVQQISTGEVESFYGWPSQYAQVIQGGTPAVYVNPTEGRLSWSCGALIMANTKHYNLALQWIDQRLSPDMGAAMVDTDYLGVPNLKSMGIADQKIVKEFGYDNPAVFAASHPAAALTSAQTVAFNQMWQQVVAGS